MKIKKLTIISAFFLLLITLFIPSFTSESAILASVSVDMWAKDGSNWVESITKNVGTELEFKITVTTSGPLAADLGVLVELPGLLSYSNWANPLPETVEDNDHGSKNLYWDYEGHLGSTTKTIYYKAEIIQTGTDINDVTALLASHLLTDYDDVEVTGVQTNNPPTATINSITPNPAEEGQSVSFSGSGQDSDGTIVGYNWRSDVDGQLSTQSSFSTTSLSVDTHTIYFKVKDNDNDWSDEVTKTLEINPHENNPPSAYIDSINPNPADEGETVYFSGHGSDSDGTIVAYNWRSDIDGQLSTQSTFSSGDLSVEAHIIYFKVKDNENEWSEEVSETLDIYSGENDPPTATINSISPNPADEGETVYFSGIGEDTDGYIVEYNWRSDKDGQLSTKSSFSSSSLSVGTHNIILKVVDNEGAWSEDSKSLQINGNEQPTATITSINPNPVDIGNTVSFKGTGSDNDGYITGYNWRSSISGQLSTKSSFSSSSLPTGTHTIYFKVKDNDNDWSDEDTETLIVNSPGNNPPNKPSQPEGATNGNSEVTYTYTSRTIDIDDDQIYYLFDWGDGTNSGWIGPYDSGAICETNHKWTEKGTYNIKVKAKDTYDIESEWSDPLSVNIPKNKVINRPILNFLKNNPNLFPIIQKLLQLLGL